MQTSEQVRSTVSERAKLERQLRDLGVTDSFVGCSIGLLESRLRKERARQGQDDPTTQD